MVFESKSVIRVPIQGEGALSQDDEKRSPMDFVLWKSSKEGEPTWESQWGAGRPGWHIECSAMCSDILGSTVDINCGGVDLSFPHHENQLAQSEAYWDCSQWVNYFVHSGHLHIDGLKMSKSLKNFITISAAMSLYTARQIRFLFLLHLWSEPMDLTPILKADGGGLEGFVQMEQAIAAESSFAEFFFMVKALNREAASKAESAETFWTQAEKSLHRELLQTQVKVDAALRDSVDTPVAVKALLELVRSANRYTARNPEARVHLVLAIARYIGQILKVFGVGSSDDEFGFGSDGGEGRGVEEILTPHLDAFVQFRDEIRLLAKEKAEPKAFLSSCDNLRDVTMPKLGVVIGDSDASGTWKLYDQKELELMMERERQEKARKEEEKRKIQEEADRANRERDLKASILPSEFFRTGEYEGKFSTYDEAGIPLTDDQHTELTKSKRKNLAKIHTAHVKNHEKWKKRNASQ
uniref:tRNA synthetases class I catalytic domain-containing protein n=1 Tax=Rhodosorus marinus TaxID=101924 RepID=A0A7S2Z9D4_9RHOD|mmetsp:Transcript_10730/g.44711  ORF Transcript_10730/g.44711 Transcript_10730/m.44711 type:complete len:467 (+) Transcript_10730:928-2328(+)